MRVVVGGDKVVRAKRGSRAESEVELRRAAAVGADVRAAVRLGHVQVEPFGLLGIDIGIDQVVGSLDDPRRTIGLASAGIAGRENGELTGVSVESHFLQLHHHGDLRARTEYKQAILVGAVNCGRRR